MTKMKKHNGHTHPAAQPVNTNYPGKKHGQGSSNGSESRGGSRQGNIGHEPSQDEASESRTPKE
jgi:hypothetical protein